MTPDNFLFLEPLLKARIKAAVSGAVHVLESADLAKVSEISQPTPAVHVLYRGYRVADPLLLQIDQTWLTVVALNNARDLAGGKDARNEAGLLAMTVIDALNGHGFAGTAPLRMAAAPEAGFRGGHFYLPLGWTARFSIWREQCQD